MTNDETRGYIEDCLQKYFDSVASWLSSRPHSVEAWCEMFQDLNIVDVEVATRRFANGRVERPRMFDDYALAIRNEALSLYHEKTGDERAAEPFVKPTVPLFNIAELARKAIEVKRNGGDVSSVFPVTPDDQMPRYRCVHCEDSKRVRCWHIRAMRLMRECVVADAEFTGYESNLTCQVICSCPAADAIAQPKGNQKERARYDADLWVRLNRGVAYAGDVARLRKWAENYQDPRRQSATVEDWVPPCNYEEVTK